MVTPDPVSVTSLEQTSAHISSLSDLTDRSEGKADLS